MALNRRWSLWHVKVKEVKRKRWKEIIHDVEEVSDLEFKPEKEDELCHYSVIGMRWGIRRGNTDKVYRKAQRKMAKLDNKAVKAQKKKLKRSNPLIRTSISDGMYKNAARRADKRIQKAMTWYKKVEKTLGPQIASQMASESAVGIGKQYYDSLMIDTK